jgi:hypothetical protein
MSEDTEPFNGLDEVGDDLGAGEKCRAYMKL